MLPKRYRFSLPRIRREHDSTSPSLPDNSQVASMTGTTTQGERIWDVVVTPFRVTLHLKDGRSVGAPLSWFPRLEKGTDAQRHRWRMALDGGSVLWPELDEDVTVSDLLRGGPPVVGGSRRKTDG